MLILCLMLGCVGDRIPTPIDISKLPRQWEIPTLYVRLPYDMSEYDYNYQLAKTVCSEFAKRLYDAFDGQVYVHKVVLCNPSQVPEKQSGVINLYQNEKIVLYHTETFMGSDPPDRPGYCYVEMPTSLLNVDRAASAMIHEWLHAFIGLGDEYKKPRGTGNVRTTDCPSDPFTPDGIATNACIMDHDETRHELCLRKDHNPDTDQGKEPCYEFAARVLREHLIASITVPTQTMRGPFNPPTVIIDAKLR